jgi:nucleosome assembly protein 1-like 1
VLTGIFDGLCLLMPNCDWCCRTEIEWIPGKNLTTKVLKKKPKNGAKNSKPVTKTERCESFFNFFNPPQVPDDEDIDQDMAEELQDLMEQDYDIGSTIRDKIIPHAVSWFTGEALQGEDFEDEDEEGNEDDEDEDDEEAEEEDEEEDEEDDDEEEVHGRKVTCLFLFSYCECWIVYS